MTGSRDVIVETRPAAGMPAAANMVDATDASAAEAVSARLAQLRGHRVRPARATAIGGLVDAVRREASRHRRQAGSFVEAWESVIPGPLRDATRVRSLRGGVARVGVRDAATRYELDAGLRSSWLGELRLACGQPIRSVRLEVDASIPVGPDQG
jgi:hypothetical protein